MNCRISRAAAILLSVCAFCSAFVGFDTVHAASPKDIPSAYVVYHKEKYYLINYEALLDSYAFFNEDEYSQEAKLAAFYFEALKPGADKHLIAYQSAATKKFVSYAAVLDKYMDMLDVGATYNWFNTDAAPSAFNALTKLHILAKDATVAGSLDVGQSGYEARIPIDNPSVETADSGNPEVPANWHNNAWGENTAVFSYPNEGHDGGRSVKVVVSGYSSGDAKWFFEPVQLEPREYVFRDYYRSNADSKVIAVITTAAGTTQYLDLPVAPASEGWAKYEATFTMPKNGVSATIYHLLSGNGYLITDDYFIGPYNYQGFNRGLVTITFDDGWEGNTQTALPIMQQYGFKSNQFYATTYIENPWVPNPRELIGRFLDDGHEIGSHSITHPDLTNLSEQEVINELEGSKNYLERFLGISIDCFATPYGAYNAPVKNKIMTYYKAHRTVDAGYNSKDNFDVSKLKCMSILSTTTKSEVEEWVKKAKEEKLWLIFLYHRVADDPGPYDTTPQDFAEHMKIINDYKVPVMTMSNAIDELKNQS